MRGAGVGHVLAEHQHGVRGLGFGGRGDARAAGLVDRQHELIEGRFVGGRAGGEILIPHQCLESEVALQRSAGRANAQHPAAA